MTNNALVDTSFLYALNDVKDKYHKEAVLFLELDNRILLVPDVILPEVGHLINNFIGHHGLRVFLQSFLQSAMLLEVITPTDLERAYEIMETYKDARFDLVDCCIFALAERSNITSICTFDRRDFSIMRPKHCTHFTLLP